MWAARLSVCWPRPWTLRKWLNQLRCFLAADLCSQGTMVYTGYIECHLANTTEQSVHGNDHSSHYRYCTNLLLWLFVVNIIKVFFQHYVKTSRLQRHVTRVKTLIEAFSVWLNDIIRLCLVVTSVCDRQVISLFFESIVTLFPIFPVWWSVSCHRSSQQDV